MSFLFGVRAEKISKKEATRRNKIAREVGGRGCGYASTPEGSWFYGPNQGEPFDSRLAAEIMQAIGEKQ